MCSLQHNNLCLLLVSQVSQRFYKLLSVHSHVPEVLNWLSFLPALFFCSCFRLLILLLFLQFLFISLLRTWYYPSFCYIIKNQFHLHSEVFLRVLLMLLSQVLVQSYISFLSDSSSSQSCLLQAFHLMFFWFVDKFKTFIYYRFLSTQLELVYKSEKGEICYLLLLFNTSFSSQSVYMYYIQSMLGQIQDQFLLLLKLNFQLPFLFTSMKAKKMKDTLCFKSSFCS